MPTSRSKEIHHTYHWTILGRLDARIMHLPDLSFQGNEGRGNGFLRRQGLEGPAYHSSHKPFVPHKVALGGVILQVSHKPDGVVILAEEQPLDEHLVSSPIRLELENAPWFAITFQGAVEARVLQTGNRLVVIGMMNRASPELFEGAQRMLPHLTARCPHIWNTEEVKNMYICTEDTTTAGRYPADECTFCLEENATGAVPNTNGKDTVSGGL